MRKEIVQFNDQYFFLSNFYPHSGGYTIEHYYQAAKARSRRDKIFVLQSPSPYEAKHRGRNINLVNDWEDIKVLVMYDLLKKKFRKGSELAELLKKTNDIELIEGNNWGDQFWGMTLEESKYVGENMLGRLLMCVRALNRHKVMDEEVKQWIKENRVPISLSI